MSDWNWHGVDEKESQVIPRVDAMAIYTNANGGIVIRQQDVSGGEDNVIIFPSSYASVVIAAIQKAASDE